MLPPVKYYDFELNGKVIEYRTWKTKDEKEFLIMKETKEEISDDDIFEFLVKPCLKDPTITLSQGEKQMLVLELRKKSFGPELLLQFQCSTCNKVNEVNFNLNEIITYTPSKNEPVTIEGITIEFKDNTKSHPSTNNPIEDNFINFIRHVKSIKVEDEIFTNISESELIEFFDNLDARMFDEFFNKLLEMNESVTYDTECNCMFCKQSQIIDLGTIPNLLPW